ncbi:MAG TPA: RNA polymerase sigma factor [Anaeromyxobacter sp.]|nr:RNA polymerase sigma factor [Anaeromyxobacter sp.]
MERLSDDEVLEGYFAAGEAKDRAACVEALFRRHYPKVVSWCLRFAGNRDEAYDLAQGVFAKAYRHLGSFRRESKFTTWLYAITRSECLNHARAQKARRGDVETALDEADELVDDARPGADEALEKAASAREVRALLDRVLDETERRVFTLHYGEDVPLDAITRLLGLSNTSGAKAYIVRARRKLERALRSADVRDQAFDL